MKAEENQGIDKQKTEGTTERGLKNEISQKKGLLPRCGIRLQYCGAMLVGTDSGAMWEAGTVDKI